MYNFKAQSIESTLFSILLILSGNVLAAEIDTTSFCSKVPWINKFIDKSWGQPKELELPGEAFGGTLYTNPNKSKKLVVEMYNRIFEGRAEVIKQHGSYYTIFSYTIHSDTTGEIKPVNSLQPFDGSPVFRIRNQTGCCTNKLNPLYSMIHLKP